MKTACIIIKETVTTEREYYYELTDESKDIIQSMPNETEEDKEKINKALEGLNLNYLGQEEHSTHSESNTFEGTGTYCE